jgi:signal transduction histidine kinase
VIERELDVMAINNHEAGNAANHVLAARSELLVTLSCLGLACLVATVLVGSWTIRRVSISEEKSLQYSKRLEQQNRELDAFASRVAHDLRGPLTTIRWAAALRDDGSKESTSGSLLSRGVEHMEGLIDELMTLSRSSEPLGSSCDPAEVAARIRQDFADKVSHNKGKLRVDVEHAQVTSSAGLLRQALANLTDNALKYRRPDATPDIEISGKVTSDDYELGVSDNGLGMSAEEVERVFDPFYRALRVRNLPGSGLGLSIVKRVAEASGGRVTVDSVLGGGSKFIIHLPLGIVRDRPAS